MIRFLFFNRFNFFDFLIIAFIAVMADHEVSWWITIPIVVVLTGISAHLGIKMRVNSADAYRRAL